MYLGVDVGGTKTLVAVLDEHGAIKEQAKFHTPDTYEHFLLELRHLATQLKTQDFKAGGIAIPGRIDRQHGRAYNLGNLGWKDINVQHDVEKIFNCPVAVENDAKLAALSEATLIKDKYHKVLYVTISTGIGYGLVVDGKIDTSIGDTGGRGLKLEHQGKLVSWEDFASGHAIVERYGKIAHDITDKETWQAICRDLAQGLIQLIAIMEPEAIVIGGSVGTYFERYGDILAAELKKYELPMVKLPRLLKAHHAEEAVVYGCRLLARQEFGNA